MVLRSIGRWKRDSDVASCESCKADFTFFRRRHHCRQCGGLFCANCSSHELLIPLIDKEKLQKVCDGCHRQKLAADKRLLDFPPQNRAVDRSTVTADERRESKAAEVRRPVAAKPQPAATKPQPAAAKPQLVAATNEVPSSEANPPQPPAAVQQAAEAVTTAAVDYPPFLKDVPPETSQPPHVDGYRESVSAESDQYEEEDSDDDFDGPDLMGRMASANAISSRNCFTSNHQVSSRHLSFLSHLQDSVRLKDTNNTLNVLLFAGPERQNSMVLTVQPNETMSDVSARLTEMYFRLEKPPFVKMTVEAAAQLRQSLRFTSEHQEIALTARAMDVVKYSRNVVLSSLPSEQLAIVLKKNVESSRSVREFLRSERSDNHDDEQF